MQRVACRISGIANGVIVLIHERLAQILKRRCEGSDIPHRARLAVLEMIHDAHYGVGREIGIVTAVIMLTIEVSFVVIAGRPRYSNGYRERRLSHDHVPLLEHSGDRLPINRSAAPSGRCRPLATDQRGRWSIAAMTRSLELKLSNGMR